TGSRRHTHYVLVCDSPCLQLRKAVARGGGGPTALTLLETSAIEFRHAGQPRAVRRWGAGPAGRRRAGGADPAPAGRPPGYPRAHAVLARPRQAGAARPAGGGGPGRGAVRLAG